MRSHSLALLTVAVLLLAGCSSLAGGPTTVDGATTTSTVTASATDQTRPGATDTQTSTDTSTPTETPVPTTPRSTATPAGSDQYPPGVDGDGIENLTALRQAHRQSLARDGATVVERRSLTTDVMTRGIFRQSVVAPGRLPYRTIERVSENGTVTDFDQQWANETVRLGRYRRGPGDEFTFQQRSYPDPADTDVLEWGLFDTIERGTFELQWASGTGEDRRFRLVATGFDPADERNRRANVTAYRGMVLVGSDGVVHRANLTVRGSPEGEPYTTTTIYEVRERGAVTVGQPAWVRDRLADALAVTVRAELVDDRHVRVTNTGRDPIPAESEFTLWWASCGRSEGVLREPLAPGESVYVWVNASENYRLGIDRTWPATNGSARPLEHPNTLIVLPPSPDGERPDALTRVDVRPATNETDAATALGSPGKPRSTGSPKQAVRSSSRCSP